MTEQITTPEAWPPVLTSRWGVVLDERGSMDVYETRERAEAERHYDDETLPLVRIDYTYIDPEPDAPAPSAGDREALAEALYVTVYGVAAARQHLDAVQRVGGRLADIAMSALAARQPAPVDAAPTVTAEQVAEAFCEPRHRDRWPLLGEVRYCGECIVRAERVLGGEVREP